MRNLILSLLLCCSATAFSKEICKYNVITHAYKFSTYFEMIGEDGYEGRVIKEALRLRTTYDLYDEEGDYIAQGICRVLSLGAIYPWAREIDLYDVRGKKIGMIDGKLLTTARTKFNLYDAQDCLVGIAYNNQESSGFIIVDPSRNERMIGSLKRNLSGKSDDWEVVIYDCDVVDMCILKIFSAFITDYQDYF